MGAWMADVEIYHEIRGFPLEWWMARTDEAQEGVDQVQAAIAAGAEANLTEMRSGPGSEGHSHIYTEVGTLGVDRFVGLTDMLDERAAWIIEFGKAGQKPHFVITAAAMAAASALGVEFEYYGA